MTGAARQLLQSPLSSVTATGVPSKVTVTLDTLNAPGSPPASPAVAPPSIVNGRPTYRGVAGPGADMPGDTTTVPLPGPFPMGCRGCSGGPAVGLIGSAPLAQMIASRMIGKWPAGAPGAGVTASVRV